MLTVITLSSHLLLQFLRCPCLDNLVAFDASKADETALVWDSGVGVPVCWTYGEVRAYANRLARQLSQLYAGREEEGSNGTGLVHPPPYVGVYANSSPELPALVLG